ncbi:MAG TPA: phosphonate metabolism protein/1,5-bisphosphokinase (PRPP-forming) PhnN [Hyphomicrobiales bacterium]|nr:phosphonate metabolism protein/1,5-bisphosphokinase (PRPP-forming) PhnN [Hyphomicrobiales bacterium]
MTMRDEGRDAAGRLGPGRLVLVVGPSGAGKDSLINGARAALPPDGGVVFARRIVTRTADPDLEDHDSIDEAGFAALLAEGGFALSWRAHGLAYGLPVLIDAAIVEGRTVVANVSRATIAEARAKYADLRVVHVTASPERLRERLMARGRESAADVEKRIARAAEIAVEGPDVVTIDNSGRLDDARAAFLAVISG